MILDNIDPNYRQCSLSVMDNIADPNITFDENGICNYYHEYLISEKEQVLKDEAGKNKFDAIIAKMKEDGKAKKYDCILGVSGGVDSSYLALLAKQSGLRVLCVHFDNGWNSELAQNNIEGLINHFGFDFETHVIDWDEYRELQRAFLNADVELQALGIDPAKLQLNEARQYVALELARACNLPAYFVSAETNSMTYSNSVSERRSLIDFSMKPILAAIEQRLSMPDFISSTGVIRFSLDEFLRTDALQRAQVYEILNRIGAMSIEQIREEEDLIDNKETR